MHKCPECGCTKYIESGQMRGYYEKALSDDVDERVELESMGWNSDLYDEVYEYPNVYVRCFDCGKRYKSEKSTN